MKFVRMCKYRACSEAVVLDQCGVLLFTSVLAALGGGKVLSKMFIMNGICFQLEPMLSILM